MEISEHERWKQANEEIDKLWKEYVYTWKIYENFKIKDLERLDCVLEMFNIYLNYDKAVLNFVNRLYDHFKDSSLKIVTEKADTFNDKKWIVNVTKDGLIILKFEADDETV